MLLRNNTTFIVLSRHKLNVAFLYSRYWTGTSLQLRLMRGGFSNTNNIYLFLMIFPRTSLGYKLVPVQYNTVQYSPMQSNSRTVQLQSNAIQYNPIQSNAIDYGRLRGQTELEYARHPSSNFILGMKPRISTISTCTFYPFSVAYLHEEIFSLRFLCATLLQFLFLKKKKISSLMLKLVVFLWFVLCWLPYRRDCCVRYRKS